MNQYFEVLLFDLFFFNHSTTIFKEYSLLIKMADYFFQVSKNIKILFDLIITDEFQTHFDRLNLIEMEIIHFN